MFSSTGGIIAAKNTLGPVFVSGEGLILAALFTIFRALSQYQATNRHTALMHC